MIRRGNTNREESQKNALKSRPRVLTKTTPHFAPRVSKQEEGAGANTKRALLTERCSPNTRSCTIRVAEKVCIALTLSKEF